MSKDVTQKISNRIGGKDLITVVFIPLFTL